MSLKRSIIVCVFLINASSLLAGGGWTKEKGKGFLKLSQYFILADSYFNPEGNIIDINPNLGVYRTAAYMEYGISNRITGIAYLPFLSRSVLNAQRQRNGQLVEGDAITTIGDTDIGFKYGIIQNKSIVLSSTITFGLPLGNAKGGRTGTLQTGDGEFNQMLSVDASKSFYPLPIYATATLGFNNRTKGFSDEVRFGFEAGYTIKKFTIIARFAGIESLRNGDSTPNAQQGVFGNNIEFMSLSPELIYKITDKFGVSASIGTAFSGRQVLANPSYEGGLFFEW
ncbi:MAG: hypothetical protein JXR03_03185 [Cyclobacteriaceae bacterium]